MTVSGITATIKKGDTVLVGFYYMGVTSYETDTVVKVTKGKIYCDSSKTPFDAATGTYTNSEFGTRTYIVTDPKELKKARRLMNEDL